MSYIKKIVISSFLFTAFFPAFLSAMNSSSFAEIQRELKAAIYAHDFEKARSCLSQGASLTENYSGSKTSLYDHYAKSGTIEQVNFLLEHFKIQGSFQGAINEHDFKRAASYLKQGASPNEHYRKTDERLLERYARSGTAKQVRFLLDNGADPFYCIKGSHVIKRSLFNATENALEIIPLLAERIGVDYVEDRASKDSTTALQHAIKVATNTDLSVIELLLLLGADPNRKDWGEATILDRALPAQHWAEPYKTNFPLVKLLYRYGADTDRRSLKKHVTPEQMAELEQAREQTRDKHVQDKALYNQELGKYLPLLPPLVEICVDYSDSNSLQLDLFLAEQEQVYGQDSAHEPVEESWCSIS